MLVHVSSKKMCLKRHPTYHLKAQRISNNMLLKHTHRGKEKSSDHKNVLQLLELFTCNPLPLKSLGNVVSKLAVQKTFKKGEIQNSRSCISTFLASFNLDTVRPLIIILLTEDSNCSMHCYDLICFSIQLNTKYQVKVIITINTCVCNIQLS